MAASVDWNSAEKKRKEKKWWFPGEGKKTTVEQASLEAKKL